MAAPSPHAERSAGLWSDIRRLWDLSVEEEAGIADEAYDILDRATAVRRLVERDGPEWAEARLAEGLARLQVARQMAEWGNRSYAIQALEAAIDGLRDAAASLPPGSSPSPDEVASFRASLLAEWRAAQSEQGLDRIAGLSMADLRNGPSK